MSSDAPVASVTGYVNVNVRRVDSLPALRAIDLWNAARWVKMKGVRWAARARMEAMMCGFVIYVCRCGKEAEVCGVF